MASEKDLINELIDARRRNRGTSFKVTLGKDVVSRLSLRVDIAQLSTYIIGMPGTGKSNLLAQLFLENQDHSKILIDPLGKMTNEHILPNLTHPERVIYFAPHEQRQQPLGFNPFDLGKQLDRDERDALAGSLRAIFGHLWLDSFKNYPQMAMVIQNCLNLLVQFEGMTFLDMARLLIDKAYRLQLVRQTENSDLRDFWISHYHNEMGISTYNKLNEFIQVRAVRRVVCQHRSSFYLQEAMAQGKTVIINLGGLQDNAKSLLGALFVSRVLAEFVRREGVPTDQLTPFALFVDEFDLFGSAAFETIISKCRQQKASVCIAHQHWGQLSPSMRQSVQQCAYVICFQVDPMTADGMRGLFTSEADLANVPRHHAWVRAQRMKTGSVPQISLVKTRPVPSGKEERVALIKNQMWSLGRSTAAIDAEIKGTYEIIQQHNINHEQPAEPPTQVQPPRREHLLRPLPDWPPRFRDRPSVVRHRVGQ